MLVQHILSAMGLIWSVAAVLLLSVPAAAQPFFFSEPTPLTTTRYAAEEGGDARLVTDGVLPYLLWTQDGKVRLTPVTPERRAGRPVLDGVLADAVWTGSHFVVVAWQEGVGYVSRRAGANGEAIGEPALVVPAEAASWPRLAFDGSRVLLVYGQEPLRAIVLSRDGLPLEEPRDVPIEGTLALDAAAAARSGEFVVASAGRRSVSMTRLRAGVWARNDRSVDDYPPRQIAVAANEVEQLTIWTNGDAPMQATYSATGTGSDYTLASTQGATAVAVTWDGKDYIYAYRDGDRIRFRFFNAPLPFASVACSLDSGIELVSVNGRTYAAYRTNQPGGPLVVRDVQALASGDAGAFAAARQELESVASSATSALFVWMERPNQLFAGVRTSAGAWYERQIANQDAAAPLAASDGSGFAIVQTTLAQGWTATLLDAQGNITGLGPRVPFFPTGMAWAGDAYVVVGLNAAQRVVASRLSLSGIVTPPVVLAEARPGREIGDARVAARDGELLVVWTDLTHFSGYRSDVLGARVSPALQRLDVQSLLLAEGTADHPDAIWDGTRYAIAWNDFSRQAVAYRTLRTNAAVSGISTFVDIPGPPRLSLVPGGVAIAAGGGNAVFVREETVSMTKLGQPGEHALVRLGGRLAHVQSIARDEMPYHGASRLNVRIGDLVPPSPKPSAPRITYAAHPTGGIAMSVEWTAPPEPVNGYRVEYRVDDGVWNELDVWFDARTRELTIRPWRAEPVRYQFRVRAVNDAGFSPYSNPATVRTRKMRAVR